MSDLAEHIGTVIAVVSALLAILGILITVIWKDLRKAIGEAKVEAKRFILWLQAKSECGGIITRDDHFEFCAHERAKCPIVRIVEWKNELYEKGGPMTMAEHTVFSKEELKAVTDNVCKDIMHNRELMMTELKLIQATIKNEVVTEIRALKEEMRLK